MNKDLAPLGAALAAGAALATHAAAAVRPGALACVCACVKEGGGGGGGGEKRASSVEREGMENRTPSKRGKKKSKHTHGGERLRRGRTAG